MPTASSLLLVLGLTVVAGGAATAWLWLVQRPRADRAEGLALLSAMRWREFSRLVVDGLRERGLEPETAEDTAGFDPDVWRLKQDGRGWLLVCKQGSQQITPSVVDDVADAMRFHGAHGAVVATLGTVDPEARRRADGRIELLDGAALWPLVRPRLGTSVQEMLNATSRRAARRQSLVAWAVSLALGLVAAAIMPTGGDAGGADSEPAVANRAGRSTTAAPAESAAMPVSAPVPMSEEEQRGEVVRMVSALPGIERALWSTRSTLLVQLLDENVDPVSGICAVVERYDALRTSRLHLQPPAGARRPARFRQCKTF